MESGMPRCIAPLIALLTSVAPAFAAPQSWVTWIHDTVEASPWFATGDGSTGQFVVGRTYESLAAPNQGLMDVWIARVSSAGSLLWVRQYGTPDWDIPSSVAPDGVGGCFFSFTTNGKLAGPNPDGKKEVVLGRLDGAGTLLWMKQYDTFADAYLPCLAADGAGGVFAAGNALGAFGGPALGDTDLWMAHFDSNGTPLWLKQFGTSAEDWIGNLVSDGQGGTFLLAETKGTLWGVSMGMRDVVLARFDGSGNALWAVQDGSASNDYAGGLVADGPAAVFVTGQTEGAFTGSHVGEKDVFVARYDGSGVREWARQFGSSLDELAFGIVRDGLGGVVAVGSTDGDLGGAPVGLSDAWVAQLRGDGTLAWMNHAGTPQNEILYAVCESSPGSFVAAGSTSGSLFGNPYNGIDKAFVAKFEACAYDAPSAYCPGSPNSTGSPATLSDQGSTSLALNDLRFSVAGGPPGEKGLVILGTQQAQNPFGNGTLCLGGNLQRILPPVTLSAEGKGIHPIDFEDPTQPTAQIAPGSTWYFQFWYRDSAAGVGDFNLSNGLSATFCP
jgi:hypothetical protein